VQGGLPFAPQLWWIDEKGCEHCNGSLTPLNEHWFLRHHGQVKIDIAPFVVEMSWDTGCVEQEAIETAKGFLSELDLAIKVHLSFYLHGWAHEVYGDTFSALERIEEIQECQSVFILHETQISTCSPSDIHYASTKIRQSYKSWERTSGRFDHLDQDELVNQLPEVLMFRPDKREENLMFSWIGMNSVAAKVYGEQWVHDSVGMVANRSFDDESSVFADKINVGISRTMISGDPLLQHIRTLVSKKNQEPFWVSYERLLTRYVLRGGSSPVVIANINPTQHVDVTLAGGT
jgi:hypothetical protein